jgi:hypothetical protein
VPGCWQDWNRLEEVTEVTEGMGGYGRRGLEEILTRSSFRSSADFSMLFPRRSELFVSF